MKDIGKITVKHFVNKNLGAKNVIASSYIDGKEVFYPKIYPLYIKITFMRKSTEVKSILDECFESAEDAIYKNGLLLAAESQMIEHFVTLGYKQNKDKFSLKGIAGICRQYQNKFIYELFNSYVLEEFDKTVTSLNSKYNLLLQNRLPSISTFTYYEAACKLLDNHPDILKFKEKFLLIKDIENIIFPGYGKLTNHSIVMWQFSTVSDMFKIEAKTLGYSKQRIKTISQIINNEISKLTS